jgi:predicted esterase
LRDAGGNVLLPGRLYVPTEATAPGAKPRPVLTFLHGAGANGTDNLAQVHAVGERMLIEAKERGAFLYVPQTVNNWSSSAVTDRVMTMIDRAIAEQNADTHRLFVTGFSNGGGGTWNMLSRYDGRFAAGIAVSSVAPAGDFVASRLVDTAVLALHARNDDVTSVNNSRNVINGILSAAGERLPGYFPAGDPSALFLSSVSLESHASMRNLVKQEMTQHFLISNPSLDLMYYDSPTGGHSGLLGVFSSPDVHDWLFGHTTAPAVPEPHAAVLGSWGCALVLGCGRRRRRLGAVAYRKTSHVRETSTASSPHTG